MRLTPLLPFILFAALVVLLGVGLGIEKQGPAITAALSKPMPTIEMQALNGGAQSALKPYGHQVFLVNFFASWCVPCIAEHAFLKKISAETRLPIIGIAYKDKVQAARAFLKKNGDPYTLTFRDEEGLVGIEWGVSGVPETYLVDGKGIIRVHHGGPLTQEVWDKKFAPWVKP
jgi:cytochrome c biogenesis protein CcmG/thiol:disulfide interchange protein DsbE